MTKAITLKLSLLGALLSLGAIAANDMQSKQMKDNAEFVEKAALISKTQVNLAELASSQSTNPSVKEFAQQVASDHRQAFNSLKDAVKEGGYSLPFQSIGSSGSSDVSDVPETGSRQDDPSAGEQLGDAARRTADDIADTSKRAADDVASAGRTATEDVTGSPQIRQSKDYMKASEKAQDKYNDLAKLSGEKFDKEFLSAVTNNNDKAIKLLEKHSKNGWDSGLKSWSDETLPTLREHERMAKSVKQNLKGDRPSM